MSLLSLSADSTPASAILRGSIYLPRVGVWHADLTVDAFAPITGAVTIATDDGSFKLAGTVYRSGIWQDTLVLRVVGGAGGLGTVVGPFAYQGAPLSVVLQAILAACGEKLSATSDASLLSTELDAWSVLGGSGKAAVACLLDPLGTSWRILADGTFWVGADTYPAAPTVDFDVLDRHFDEARIVIGSERPFLFPGTTLTLPASATGGPQQVSYVVHEIQAASIRAEVWFEQAGAT